MALKKGDYKDTVKEQPGSSSVVQGVASDLEGRLFPLPAVVFADTMTALQ